MNLHGGMTCGAAFQAIARAAVERIAADAEALGSKPGPEAIHQTRMSVRRLRSALSIFKPVAGDQGRERIDAELTWLTGELDPARNLDVLLAGAYRRAMRGKGDRTDVAELGRDLRALRAVAYGRARAAAQDERLRTLLREGSMWIEAGPWTAAGAKGAAIRDGAIEDFAADVLGGCRQKVERRGRGLARLEPKDRHRLRIQAKRMRYGAEVFAALFDHPRRARRFAQAVKNLVALLGDLNDIATGEEITRDMPAPASLIAREAARARGLIASASAAFKEFREAAPFWPKKT